MALGGEAVNRRAGVLAGREDPISGLVIESGQSYLLEVVDARYAIRRRPELQDGGEEQAEADRQEGEHD